MRTSAIRSAYKRYANVYDVVFGDVFEAGRRRATDIVNRTAGPRRILEIGVGTGLSLDRYRPEHRVVGIDLSPDMLKRAQRRVAQRGLAQVEALMEMNAETLAFADESFDVVAAMYVLSVASDPLKVIREMIRVCKPGGTLIVVNHVSDGRNPVMDRIERMLSPLAGMLGWRPHFPLTPLLEKQNELAMVGIDRQPPLGMFAVIELRKQDTAEAA